MRAGRPPARAGIRTFLSKMPVGASYFIAGDTMDSYNAKTFRKASVELGLPIRSVVHHKHPTHGMSGIEIIRLPVEKSERRII
ncbi:hypothetical protein Nazgul16 [Burkholderia phage BcepNazgul]|uniref:Uncharacterized protein n=1 Tax=Burkholderia phage BcepNazgul TaxID=242861 RepID=Q6UYE9_9CAUD|nr:hypothetical protein Nazgul16 [Burkholderia phage BcepNazgul]AAQ63392.1 hypothetical protein Nazgul16 [Burkholderia phage BcepNazgul]